MALLTLQKPGKFTAKERRDVVRWLLKQAQFITKNGKNLTDGRYTSSFNYT